MGTRNPYDAVNNFERFAKRALAKIREASDRQCKAIEDAIDGITLKQWSAIDSRGIEISRTKSTRKPTEMRSPEGRLISDWLVVNDN